MTGLGLDRRFSSADRVCLVCAAQIWISTRERPDAFTVIAPTLCRGSPECGGGLPYLTGAQLRLDGRDGQPLPIVCGNCRQDSTSATQSNGEARARLRCDGPTAPVTYLNLTVTGFVWASVAPLRVGALNHFPPVEACSCTVMK